MKVLIALSLVIVGVLLVESLNEDQIRDQLNYVSKRRSKRAVCGSSKPVRPSYCRYCYCGGRPPFIVSKRAATKSSSKMFYPGRGCSNYITCCNSALWRSASAVKASSAKSIASKWANIYGKRATKDAQFKKPSVDLIFLIDDSGSIPASQFRVAKEGAATLSTALCPHEFGSKKGGKQVSVVLFSTTPQTVLTYKESQKGSGFVEDKILDMKQRSGSTATADALRHVREKVLTQPGSRLNDKDTATIVVVVTDGKCNSGCNQLLAEAEKLRGSGPGVQVFAFGVGEADCQELKDIRGKDSGADFGLPDYNFFEKIANAMKEQMSKNADKLCVKS